MKYWVVWIGYTDAEHIQRILDEAAKKEWELITVNNNYAFFKKDK
jgi:hypothetical protein